MTTFGYQLKLVRRATLPSWKAAVFSILAVLFGLVLFSSVFLQAHVDPIAAYKEIFSYAFVNTYGLRLTISRFIFLALVTYAFIIPFRAGLWNIGMSGQLYVGALAAFGVAYAFGGRDSSTIQLPAGLVIPLMMIAAAAGGGLVGGIAGFLKGRWNVNEIVSTMMLNFIAFYLTSKMIKEGGVFMNPGGRGESFELPASIRAPTIMDVPTTIFLVLVLVIFLQFLFAKTSLGYKIRAFGHNPMAAHYAGIDTGKLSVLVFVMGGAFAGLAAYHYFGAVPGVFKIPRNYGYFGDLAFYGIICGLISMGNPLAALPVAFFFGGLSIGGRFAQGKLHLGFGVDYALLGVLMITLVMFQFFYRYQMMWMKKEE